MDKLYTQRGFLPLNDPLTHFPYDSEFAVLDTLGHDLPSMLEDKNFRAYARTFNIPTFTKTAATTEDLPLLHLLYVRLGFLASAYINQVDQERATLLPNNIAAPLVKVCNLLKRPPILSYDGYALYNWKRFRKDGPIALGNIDTIQNFVHLYDEHWFILIHVEIEAIAAKMFGFIQDALAAATEQDGDGVNAALSLIEQSIWQQTAVLRRIPEKMDPGLYFKRFRPYIRYFENVVYEGIDQQAHQFRGETGAQSTIFPVLIAFMKIEHQSSVLTEHLRDMRQYMPAAHRALLEELEQAPSIKPFADNERYNGVLEAMATFRETHYGWAQEYIHRRTEDPNGTGGTPYMKWLKQLIDETRAHKLVSS